MQFMIAALILAAAAPEEAPNPRYLECVNLVEADLEKGREHAQRWSQEGGGAEAQHCLAIADIAAGFAKLGAARLEEVSNRKDAGDDYVRARLLAQAAEAWLIGAEPEHAERALTAAFELAADSGELYLTAAKVHAAKKEWQRVISAVSTAEASGFQTAETYVLSARAQYAVGDYEAAAVEIVKALSLEPTNIEALVLRGEIQQTGVPIEVYFGDAQTPTE